MAIIPAAFIEAAERHIARRNRPLLKTFLETRETFYVTRCISSWQLHIGDPCYEPPIPTWREWIREREPVMPSRIGETWLQEEYGITREELDEEMAEDVFMDDYGRRGSPSADAFDFLEGIPLTRFHDEDGLELGYLSFEDGASPMNDSKIVDAKDLLSISCLQYALEARGYRCNFKVE